MVAAFEVGVNGFELRIAEIVSLNGVSRSSHARTVGPADSGTRVELRFDTHCLYVMDERGGIPLLFVVDHQFLECLH